MATRPWRSGELEAGRAQAAAWYGQRHSASWFATAHEPSLWRAIADAEPYPVTALVVQHRNPLGANGNLRAVERALASPRLDLLVVHDLFMTPTAEYADYVLPAAHWLEKPYLSFGIGFVGAFGDCVAASHVAVAAPPGVRADYELWRDLGRRLDSAAAWPDKVEDFYSACVAGAGLDFATVAACGPLVGADARHPQRAESAVDAPSRYGTPSGRIELESSLLAGWGLPALPTPARPAIERAGATYPLVLTTGGRRIEAFHENAQHRPRFRAHHPHPRALIQPATAAQAGIAAGDWMHIETPLGSVRQLGECSEAVQADVIEADRWWDPEGTGDVGDAYGVWSTNINVTTSDAQADSDATMGAWLLRGLPCRVRPARAQRARRRGRARVALEVHIDGSWVRLCPRPPAGGRRARNGPKPSARGRPDPRRIAGIIAACASRARGLLQKQDDVRAGRACFDVGFDPAPAATARDR